jgi:hypothetical protein
VDSIISNKTSDYDLYFNALLPLLETVVYSHKDATLISFGAKKTGNDNKNITQVKVQPWVRMTISERIKIC